MRYEPPRMDELMAIVRDNPGFVLMDHVDALDWGDLTKYDNYHARDLYHNAVSSALSALVKQGYLRRDNGQKPPRFFVRETIEPAEMKGPKYKHYVEYNGERVPLAELCKRHGIKRSTVHSRVIVHGWPLEEALTAPPDKHRRHKRGN